MDDAAKISKLLSDSCSSGSDMTHALKHVGDGSMKNGIKKICDYYTSSGFKKGAVFGTAGALTVCGLIKFIKSVKAKNDKHKKMGEEIIAKLEESSNSTDDERIEKDDNLDMLDDNSESI